MAAIVLSDPSYELSQRTLNNMAIWLLDNEARFFSKDRDAWNIEFDSYGFTDPLITKERVTELRKLCKDRGKTLYEQMQASGASQTLGDTRGRGSAATGKGVGETVQFKVWCQTWKNVGWDGALTMPAGWTGGDVWNVIGAPAALNTPIQAAPVITQAPATSTAPVATMTTNQSAPVITQAPATSTALVATMTTSQAAPVITQAPATSTAPVATMTTNQAAPVITQAPATSTAPVATMTTNQAAPVITHTPVTSIAREATMTTNKAAPASTHAPATSMAREAKMTTKKAAPAATQPSGVFSTLYAEITQDSTAPAMMQAPGRSQIVSSPLHTSSKRALDRSSIAFTDTVSFVPNPKRTRSSRDMDTPRVHAQASAGTVSTTDTA